MSEIRKDLRILDRRGADHDYLHRDFHGALCYSIYYLDEKFGPDAAGLYLRQVGTKNYLGLIKELKSEGLSALERHWNRIFSKEGGEFEMHYESETLVLSVEVCPAIAHLHRTNQLFTTRYCETTAVVNETVCSLAGYRSSCDYVPGEGRCIQKFWQVKGR